ncbi:MAG TPA: hypothetical protein VL500_05375 [Candidatus Eisenbacteria bacterium]|nr:hypothetical protein [Candidatus Eisenbacteria bacterium]
MRTLTLVAVLVVSLAVGYLAGTVLPWWGTALVVVGALAYVRLRLAGGK